MDSMSHLSKLSKSFEHDRSGRNQVLDMGLTVSSSTTIETVHNQSCQKVNNLEKLPDRENMHKKSKERIGFQKVLNRLNRDSKEKIGIPKSFKSAKSGFSLKGSKNWWEV